MLSPIQDSSTRYLTAALRGQMTILTFGTQFLSSKEKPKGQLELVCTSVRKYHSRLAIVLACAALGAFFTLIVCLSRSEAPPVAPAEKSSASEAQLLRMQAYHARSAKSSAADVNPRDIEAGSSTFQGLSASRRGGSQQNDRFQDIVHVSGDLELQPTQTLVLYIFSNIDEEYINNFRFFVRHGMREGDGCEYIVVVHTGDGSPVRPIGSRIDIEMLNIQVCILGLA